VPNTSEERIKRRPPGISIELTVGENRETDRFTPSSGKPVCPICQAALQADQVARLPGLPAKSRISVTYTLSLSVSTHAANHHEVRLFRLCFDLYMIEAKPEHLIANHAHDSDSLDEEVRNDGIELIALNRSNFLV
jgi:hypothetical protein